MASSRPGEEADHQSGALLELEDRLLAVGNVAQRGGGEDRPVLNVEGIQDGPEAEQGICGPVEALPAHGAVLPNIAGQAGRLLALKNAVDSSVLLHLIDIQADGIGADVDNSVHASSPLWLRSARKRDRII